MKVYDFRRSRESPFVVIHHPFDLRLVEETPATKTGYSAPSTYVPRGYAYLSDSEELLSAYIGTLLRKLPRETQ